MQWILCAIYAIRIPWHARPPLGHELEMGSESSHGHLKNLGHARRRMSRRQWTLLNDGDTISPTSGRIYVASTRAGSIVLCTEPIRVERHSD